MLFDVIIPEVLDRPGLTPRRGPLLRGQTREAAGKPRPGRAIVRWYETTVLPLTAPVDGYCFVCMVLRYRMLRVRPRRHDETHTTPV